MLQVLWTDFFPLPINYISELINYFNVFSFVFDICLGCPKATHEIKSYNSCYFFLNEVMQNPCSVLKPGSKFHLHATNLLHSISFEALSCWGGKDKRKAKGGIIQGRNIKQKLFQELFIGDE
jgi:hypothetical protein